MFSTKKNGTKSPSPAHLRNRNWKAEVDFDILQCLVTRCIFTFSSIEEVGGSVNQCLVVESDKGLEEGGTRKNETAKYVEFIISSKPELNSVFPLHAGPALLACY